MTGGGPGTDLEAMRALARRRILLVRRDACTAVSPFAPISGSTR